MNVVMPMNLEGRLGNFTLATDKPLLPVFEAISNSIHSIEDKKGTGGKITVRIHREETQHALIEDMKPTQRIVGFTIEDNGIGFTDINFRSFGEADSTLKRNKGGKGVGRFCWLKAFDSAEVDSTFQSGKTWHHRRFNFAPTGIEHHGVEDLDSGKAKTTVKFVGFKHEYQKHCPKQTETIAGKIIEHFLEELILTKCPPLWLVDDYEGTKLELNRVFRTQMNLETHEETIKLKSDTFKVKHLRLSQKLGHAQELHLCALKRSVESRDLTKLLPNLNGHLAGDDGQQFVYAAYVSGKALDRFVNQERTKIELPHDYSLFADQNEPTLEGLIRRVAESSAEFLEKYLTPIKEQKLARIKEYAQKRPRFRSVLTLRPQWLDAVKSGLSESDLDIELYKLMHRLEIESRQEGVSLKETKITRTAQSLEKHKSRFAKFVTEQNSLGLSMLAEHVVHRRAVIDFLSECQKVEDDGKYPLEDVVHQVIFPMKETSGTIKDPELSNLWMIDERLSYHYHLSSDLDFKTVGEVTVEAEGEKKRVDLLVLQRFEVPHAFVGSSTRPFDSITLVEFKRPMRNDYVQGKEEDDPIKQVWEYANRIKAGSCKDKHGQLIRVGSNVQAFAYVICTITKKIQEMADTYGFTQTPDGMGYFHWHKNFGIYTEILDYDKVIQDAKRRNEVFFDKLCLPAT